MRKPVSGAAVAKGKSKRKANILEIAHNKRRKASALEEKSVERNTNRRKNVNPKERERVLVQLSKKELLRSRQPKRYESFREKQTSRRATLSRRASVQKAMLVIIGVLLMMRPVMSIADDVMCSCV